MNALRRLTHVACLTLVALGAFGCEQSAPPAAINGKTPAGATGAAAKPPSDADLRADIDRVLEYTFTHRHLDVDTQWAWQVVHGALAFGRDFKVLHQGQPVRTIDYLLGGGTLSGWTLRKADHGIDAVVDPGSLKGQGHKDQWLGYLSQCGIQPGDRLAVGGTDYTVSDLLTQAQWDISDTTEATWSLMAFATYVPLDASWPAKDGTNWSIARVLEFELKQDLAASACGGTHRLYGITCAVNRWRASGQPFTGPWQQADELIAGCIAKARDHQQPDGSFSTSFFERPGTSSDIEKRLHATGHTLEFLVFAMNDQQLAEPWLARGAAALVSMLDRTRDFDLECGALYHAIHGLQLYRARRFSPWQPPADAS